MRKEQSKERTYFEIGKLVNMYANRQISTKNAIQRNEIWDIKRKSTLIWTILSGFNYIDPITARFDNDLYDVYEGKQRLSSIIGFAGNKYRLCSVPEIIITNNGEEKVYDITGLSFKNLPKELKTIFKKYKLAVDTYTGYTDDEVALIFEIKNSGMPMSIPEKLKSNILRIPNGTEILNRLIDISTSNALFWTNNKNDGGNKFRIRRDYIDRGFPFEYILHAMMLVNKDAPCNLEADDIKNFISKDLTLESVSIIEDIINDFNNNFKGCKIPPNSIGIILALYKNVKDKSLYLDDISEFFAKFYDDKYIDDKTMTSFKTASQNGKPYTTSKVSSRYYIIKDYIISNNK